MTHPTIRQIDSVLAKIERVVPFDPKWNNGTGYFDHLVKEDLELKDGEVVRFVDNMMRNGIIIGSPLGNLVVFERRTRKLDKVQSHDAVIVVTNLPRELRWMYPNGLTSDEFNTILGIPGNPNLGERLAEMQKVMIDRYIEKVHAEMELGE